jgi:hypothetical protein
MTRQRSNDNQRKREKLPRRKCPICWQSFVPNRPWQKYDSLECGMIERNRRRTARVREALERMDDQKMDEVPHG